MDLQLAYIAGIIDGEGSLTIGKYFRKGNRHLGYRGYLAIANTNIPLLLWIKGIAGGKIVRMSVKYKDETRLCYSLTLTTNKIRYWLPQLLQFLIVKKDQAEVLLAFLERQADNTFAPISDELLKFYEVCYQKMKVLKKKRYEFKEEKVSLGFRNCLQCGKEFEFFSNQSSHKKYCSNYCKRKIHWIRSNKRISEGRPAWESSNN